MDLAKQAALIEHVRERGGRETQVAVTLEQFFDGNDCEWSIAPDRSEDLLLDDVRRALVALRRHPDVHDVRIELDQLELDTYPDDEWPYASGAAVVTTLMPDEVDALLLEAEVDPSGGPAAGLDWLVDAPPIPEGHHYVGVWWS
ncbi:hypothetical protein [Intrasporangium sp. DVR]|uniref:hypothetical protein n=1 Tax=Intrasporangium sp. DVR TaxID=3127867 RepID=UPI00313A5BB6